MRARRVPYGVRVDGGVEPGVVDCAWTVLEGQARRMNECSGRWRGELECEVRSPRKPIVGTMLGYLGRVEVGGRKQKEGA